MCIAVGCIPKKICGPVGSVRGTANCANATEGWILFSTVQYVCTGLGGQHQERREHGRELAVERRHVNCTGWMVMSRE